MTRTRSPLEKRVGHWLAVWFGCGHFPGMPGTIGTVGAIPLYLLLRPHGLVAIGVAAVVTTLVGVWAASVVAEETGKKDPQIVVIDEVAGYLVTQLCGPLVGWQGVLVGFVLFRICDQVKPWPARAAEKLPSGWGIVMDDVLAGVWAAGGMFAMRAAGWL